MNWITTNIRFPEDVYMELKMQAAQSRKSISEIIRRRVAKHQIQPPEEDQTFIKNLRKFAKQMKKATKGKSLSRALIEMRYEQ